MSKQTASLLWKEVATRTTRRGKPLSEPARKQKLEAMKPYAEGLADPGARKVWVDFINAQTQDIKKHVTDTVGLAVDIMCGNVPRAPGQSCADRLAQLRLAKAQNANEYKALIIEEKQEKADARKNEIEAKAKAKAKAKSTARAAVT